MSTKFRIAFMVDGPKLGDVLSMIHGQVSDLDVSLVESVPHTKNKRPNGPRTGKTADLLLQAITKSPEGLPIKAGRELLKRHGFVGEGVYSLKTSLLKKGLIDYKNGVMRLPK
jgi:hypothetical protein